jgi:lactoylglutathione lyase
MKRIDYAIVFVSDMKRSVEFYRDVLGLPLKFESPEWTEFATEGTTLALHGKRENSSQASGDPTPAGSCHAGFMVDSIDVWDKKWTLSGANNTRIVPRTSSSFPPSRETHAGLSRRTDFHQPRSLSRIQPIG